MGYFKKKRKERVSSSTKSNKLVTSQNPSTKNCRKFECLALRGNAKLSISSIYDLYSVLKRKCPPSLYAGKMGAYWAAQLPMIPVTISEPQISIGSPQAISLWHSLYLFPNCSFIKECIISVIYTQGMRQFL